jgi:hypothetical protein
VKNGKRGQGLTDESLLPAKNDKLGVDRDEGTDQQMTCRGYNQRRRGGGAGDAAGEGRPPPASDALPACFERDAPPPASLFLLRNFEI